MENREMIPIDGNPGISLDPPPRGRIAVIGFRKIPDLRKIPGLRKINVLDD